MQSDDITLFELCPEMSSRAMRATYASSPCACSSMRKPAHWQPLSARCVSRASSLQRSVQLFGPELGPGDWSTPQRCTLGSNSAPNADRHVTRALDAALQSNRTTALVDASTRSVHTGFEQYRRCDGATATAIVLRAGALSPFVTAHHQSLSSLTDYSGGPPGRI